jgi:segregation and condensation protein A
MTSAPSDGLPTLSEYQLRLPTYEGPLDVLLRLIERSQFAIEDVSLVAVTHQFLTFIEELVEASPDVVAEFTAVGARLTVLKSRSLLPRPPATEDEIHESDLVHQLREYQRIKLLAAHLQGVHAAGTTSYDVLARGAVKVPAASATVRLAHQDASSLLQALRRRLSAVPRPATIVQQRPIVSLRELVTHVSACVDRLQRVQFSTVVQEYRDRTDVATAFLAVLVLVRRQAIVASQGDVFSDIELSQHLQPIAPNGNDVHDDDVLFRYAVNNDRR